MNKVRLTESDYEVMNLVKQGLSNQQIAAKVHKSIKTVQNKLCIMYSLFGINNRVQLVFVPEESYYVSGKRRNEVSVDFKTEIEKLNSKGVKPRQIANRLEISSSTVYYHLKSLKVQNEF